ncbi:hypothetical protein BLNAU_19602 [Blattamonas nauphoetae]|uniref:FYVE-type domain-containing protein n=1 Tax=Blattamonas nauphoetae TaxID=2049346 RepID=A0ABQ9X119_9EUKA|nr:hypothetical protein BLNAU_19602 [Blattamonas nauphoetae]
MDRISSKDHRKNLSDYLLDHDLESFNQYLTDNRVNLNFVDDLGWTILHECGDIGTEPFFRVLKKRGSDMNEQTLSSGETVSHRILRRVIDLKENGYQISNDEEVNSLLRTVHELGCDLNIPNFCGETITHLCCQFGLISQLDTILSLNSTPPAELVSQNATDSESHDQGTISDLPLCLSTVNTGTGWTVLHYCLCSDTPLETLQHLFTKYPAIATILNTPDSHGQTLVHWVAKGRETMWDWYAKEKGIERTSISSGHRNAMKLIESVFSPNLLEDIYPQLPIKAALKSDAQLPTAEELDEAILSFFNDHGANVNLCDNINFSPLHYAVISDHFDVASFLIKNHANPEGHPITPLPLPLYQPPPLSPMAWAVIHNRPEFIYLLANAGATFNLNSVSSTFQTSPFRFLSPEKIFETMHGMTDPQTVAETQYQSRRHSIVSQMSETGKTSENGSDLDHDRPSPTLSPQLTKPPTTEELTLISPRIFSEQDWEIPNPVWWLVRCIPIEIIAQIDSEVSVKFWELVEEEKKQIHSNEIDIWNMSPEEVESVKQKAVETVYQLYPTPYCENLSVFHLAVALGLDSVVETLCDAYQNMVENDDEETAPQRAKNEENDVGNESEDKSDEKGEGMEDIDPFDVSSFDSSISKSPPSLSLILNALHPLPLHFAAFLGYPRCVSSLVMHGASPLIPHSLSIASIGSCHSIRTFFTSSAFLHPTSLLASSQANLPSSSRPVVIPSTLGASSLQLANGWFPVGLAAGAGRDTTVLALCDPDLMRMSPAGFVDDFSLFREETSKLNVCLSQMPRRMEEVERQTKDDSARQSAALVPYTFSLDPLSSPQKQDQVEESQSRRNSQTQQEWESCRSKNDENSIFRSTSTLSVLLSALLTHFRYRLKELCPSSLNSPDIVSPLTTHSPYSSLRRNQRHPHSSPLSRPHSTASSPKPSFRMLGGPNPNQAKKMIWGNHTRGASDIPLLIHRGGSRTGLKVDVSSTLREHDNEKDDSQASLSGHSLKRRKRHSEEEEKRKDRERETTSATHSRSPSLTQNSVAQLLTEQRRAVYERQLLDWEDPTLRGNVTNLGIVWKEGAHFSKEEIPETKQQKVIDEQESISSPISPSLNPSPVTPIPSQSPATPIPTQSPQPSPPSTFSRLLPFLYMCLQLSLTNSQQRVSVFHLSAARNNAHLIASLAQMFHEEGERMLTALPGGEQWKHEIEEEEAEIAREEGQDHNDQLVTDASSDQPETTVTPTSSHYSHTSQSSSYQPLSRLTSPVLPKQAFTFSEGVMAFFAAFTKSLFGVLADGTDSNLRSPLVVSLALRHSSYIEEIAQFSPELSIIDVNGDSLVHFCTKPASQQPHLPHLKKTPSFTPDEGTDNAPETFLARHFAQGSVDVPTQFLSTLIARGVNVCQPDASGTTPLHDAVQLMNPHMTALLLSAGASPDEPDQRTGNTPLHIAAMNKMVGTINHILTLSLSCRVDVLNYNRQTPLHLAVIARSSEIVKLLLENQADPNVPDKKGWTPLHYACSGSAFSSMALKEQQMKIIESLIRNGAHPLVPTLDGSLAFDLLQTPTDKQYLAEVSVECLPRSLLIDGEIGKEQNQSLLETIALVNKNTITHSASPFSLSSRFIHSTPTLHPASPVLHTKQPTKPPPPLIPATSKNCPSCSASLGILSNKLRQCYVCQKLLCSKCQSDPIPLFLFGEPTPQYLCQTCFKAYFPLSDADYIDSLYPQQIPFKELLHSNTHFPPALERVKKGKKAVLQYASLYTVVENGAKMYQLNKG